MANPVRITACFSGTVQGVGFRYTTVRIAARLPNITGYVRNLPDTTVEVVAEGPLGDVESLLDALRAAMNAYIDRVEQHQTAATGEFGRFGISH